MNKFIGFKPDIDPVTPGVITDCDDLLPTIRGFKSMPAPVSTLLPALAAAAVGAAVVVKLDGTSRMFAGTTTKLYESASSSWTDRSKGGAAYSAGTFWRFAQFGNDTLAVNKAEIVQQSSTAAFSDVTNSPKASCIDASAGFVMLGSTNEATYGDQTDRWWCSAYQDATSATAFTPSVTTQCTTGRLVDAPGAILAIRALGSNFVAYKAKSMFLGTYVGAPSVWAWLQVPGEIGCSSQEAIVATGTSHMFVGDNNIYKYDGTRPIPIGDEIKRWFFADLNKPYRHLIKGLHEVALSRVWFFYPSGLSATNNAAIVYNYVTGTWGKCSISTECAVEYLSGQITWDSMGTLYATWDDLPLIAYDSQFWLQSTPLPTVFNTSHVLQTITGISAGCSITTGDMGDDTQLSTISRARPHFTQSPTSGTMINYYKDDSGAGLTLGVTATLTNGKFDVLRSSRWHRLKYSFVGDCEIIGDTVTLIKDGTE